MLATRRAEDRRAATICATILNAAPFRKKHRTFKADDFLKREAPSGPQPDAVLLHKAKMWAAWLSAGRRSG